MELFPHEIPHNNTQMQPPRRVAFEVRITKTVKLRVLSHVLVNSWISLRNVKRKDSEIGNLIHESFLKLRMSTKESNSKLSF